jgi:hypothetical protein
MDTPTWLTTVAYALGAALIVFTLHLVYLGVVS